MMIKQVSSRAQPDLEAVPCGRVVEAARAARIRAIESGIRAFTCC